MIEREYRVLGTNHRGEQCVVEKPDAESARRSAEEMNHCATYGGQVPDWRAEYADVEWKTLGG